MTPNTVKASNNFPAFFMDGNSVWPCLCWKFLFNCVSLSDCIVWNIGKENTLLLAARSYELYQEEFRKWRSRGRGRWNTASELRVSGVLLAGERSRRLVMADDVVPRSSCRGQSQPSSSKISRAEGTLGYSSMCSLLWWFRVENDFPFCPKIKSKQRSYNEE